MRKIILLISIVFQAILIQAQELKGTVTDETGSPLPGANIVGTVSKSYAVTDFDGNYTIKLSKGENIKVSYIGYKEQIMAPTFPNMNIQMQPEATSLNEVVVVGYGTRKAVDATMSIAKVKSEEISKSKVLNPVQGTQGKLSGVTIVGNDTPGAEPNIIIRGLNSFANAGSQPLYVVDGFYQSNINNLNSNNIETFEILKDASALAIYGNQASNGVVIITTKKGKGDLKITTDSYFGIRAPLKIVKMAESNQFALYNNLASQTVMFSQDQPVNTNWIKETIKMGMYNSNDITLSGSTEKLVYTLNANTYNENTILEGAEYHRNTFRLLNEFKLTPKTKLNSSVNVGFTNIVPKSIGVLNTAYKQSPIVPVFFDNGKYGQSFLGNNGYAAEAGSSFNNVGNPVSHLAFQNEKSKNINVILSLGFDASITNYLKYNAIFGTEINNWRGYAFSNYLGAHKANNSDDIDFTGEHENALTLNRSNNSEWNFNNFFTLNKDLGKAHNFDVMVGLELIKKGGGEYLGGNRFDMPEQENYWQFAFSQDAEDQSVWGGQGNDIKKYSVFGRLQYKLLDKYLLTANIRRDGSSQYLPGYQWGTFPSIGAGWVISKEKFLKNNKTLTLLKLRGGWGVLGNADFGRNIQTLSSGTTGYSFGSAPVPYVTNSTFIDPNISWEETREASVGIDFEFAYGLFKGSIDLYDKLNRNAIFYISAPSVSGTDGAVPKHAGKISNKGFETSLTFNKEFGENFRLNIGGNFSYNDNKLLEVSKDVKFSWTQDLGNGPNGGLKMMSNYAVGQPIGSYYLFAYAGLDDQGRMLYHNNAGQMVTQGGSLSTKDRRFFGSAIPTATFGANFNIGYKNLELSVAGYGTLGSMVFNAKKAQRISNENIELSVAEDYWTPTNTDAANPAPISEIPYASDYYLESGDFFRINNINLSYTLPSITKFIEGATIYVNAINPFIFQKFSGFSPEISGNPVSGMGVESSSFPTLRSFVSGVKFNF